MRKLFLTIVMLLATWSPVHAQLSADSYDSLPVVALDRVVPRALIRSGNHRVLNGVTVNRNALQFEIESDFGTYLVNSLPMVSLRVREITTLAQAIDQYNRDNRELAKELRGRLVVGADSFVDILTSPLQTASSLVGQFGTNVGQTFTELNEFSAGGPDQADLQAADQYTRLMPSDPILASHKRNIASQLKLDVYSSNARVQELLITLARARSSGQASAGVVSISHPNRVEARIATDRLDNLVQREISRHGPQELYQRNFAKLSAADIETELVHTFLSYPGLSPTHKTSIAEYLANLGGVDNRGALLTAALNTNTEEQALGYQQVARMLVRYHLEMEPLAGLRSGGHVLLAVTKGRRLLVVLPFDLLLWDAETDRVFSALAEFAVQQNYPQKEILLTGILTEKARRNMDARQFKVSEHYMFSQ